MPRIWRGSHSARSTFVGQRFHESRGASFPEYPAIMYYLGYHAVKYLHEKENFTINSLLETPLTKMQEPIRTAVRELAQGWG